MKINDYHTVVDQNLLSIIKNEYNCKTILPKYENIFKALNLTSKKEIKVVLLGQDPYPNIEDANGLAFSVDRSEKLPKSLNNIFKELNNDLKVVRKNGDLTDWANQGVLLLNSILTVEAKKPASHEKLGWEQFTNNILIEISNDLNNVVFILLGNKAQQKRFLINENKHLVITAPHPSPLSAYRGFFGSKIFSVANDYLFKNNQKPIRW